VKARALIAVLIGLALATAVAGYLGFGAVLEAVGRIGWRGLAFLSLYTFLPFALLGGAWFALANLPIGGRLGVFVWARMVRDAATELLPFSQIGGFVLGARAAMLQGVGATEAFSTTVADVTAELIAQLGFTALGVALLIQRAGRHGGEARLVQAGVIGLALTALAAAALVAAQRRGVWAIAALTHRFVPRAEAGSREMGAALSDIYSRPGRFALAVGIHLLAWVASAVGVWAALRLAQPGVDLSAILAIEALVGAVRSAAFLAPMGIGVQEAAYALIGPVFGLGAETALAISLLKRARDLVVGIPILLVWQTLEGRGWLAGRRRGGV
jgi:putative membrane protein